MVLFKYKKPKGLQMTEKQYQLAKAELTNRFFNDQSYTDDQFVSDLKSLDASWLVACYNKTL